MFLCNRDTGIYSYVHTSQVLTVCTDVPSCRCDHTHRAHGWEKLASVECVGLSVLVQCVHLIP